MIWESVTGGGVGAQVDPAYDAGRISIRPPETGTLGSYRQGLFTGTMAAALAANSEVMQFRYTGSNLCLVTCVMFHGVSAVVAFAAGSLSFRLLFADTWTVDGTGGQPTSTATEAGQLDSTFATPVASLRVATTLALGAGTKTLQGVTANAQGIGFALGFTAPAVPAVGVQVPSSFLYRPDGPYDHPQVLRANQGLVVVATVPATGTWITGFSVAWTEMAPATWK